MVDSRKGHWPLCFDKAYKLKMMITNSPDIRELLEEISGRLGWKVTSV